MYSVRLKITRFRNTVLNFVEKWNAYNVLCKVEMTIYWNTVLNFVEKWNAYNVEEVGQVGPFLKFLALMRSFLSVSGKLIHGLTE